MASPLVQYPGAGCVVEFMEGNVPHIAWVMEEQGGKLRLLLPNRREMSMGANRLLPWSGPRYETGKSREDIVALLQGHKEKRESLAQGLDPVELWEMGQGEVEKASALWLAELVFSGPDADAVAACGHVLLGCKSHFRFQPPEFEIYTTDMVEARQKAEDASREREALVGGGAEWFRLLWEARQARKPAPDAAKYAPPEPVYSRLARILLARIADPETQEDESLWRQVSKELPDDPHLPLLLAITWGLLPEHYNYWLDRADYEPGDAWCAAHEGGIAALNATLETRQGEVLPETLISIDSASTRDIDDAFFVEARPEGGWKAVVSLACPAFGWAFGGELDKAVAYRATSIYLPEGNHHMMPECLGTSAYSLHAGELRPSLVFRCEVDESGVLVSGEPEFAWVKLAANLSYIEAEAALKLGDAEAAMASEVAATQQNPAIPYSNNLRAAMALAEARLAHRVAQGAVIIDRPDPEFYLVGEGADISVHLKESPPTPKAQLLVSEMMVLANASLASWALRHEVPVLFRTQDVAVPREFAGVWSTAPDIARVVKAMAPASLETSPRPHAGMGLAAYSPVTSPLRRYSDLINEAQVLSVLTEGAPRLSKAQMEALLPGLNARLDAAGQVQRFRPRYWKYLYIQQRAKTMGDACGWEAEVAEENDAWVSISLNKEQLNLRGKRALFGEKVFPGQTLMVRLGKVNALRGEVNILAVCEA